MIASLVAAWKQLAERPRCQIPSTELGPSVHAIYPGGFNIATGSLSYRLEMQRIGEFVHSPFTSPWAPTNANPLPPAARIRLARSENNRHIVRSLQRPADSTPL